MRARPSPAELRARRAAKATRRAERATAVPTDGWESLLAAIEAVEE